MHWKDLFEHNLQRYQTLFLPDSDVIFWDFIIVTASDPQQAQLFRDQIQDHFLLGLLPALRGCHRFPQLRPHPEVLPLLGGYLPIADPEGERIGCGGSTLRLLHLLAASFGPEVFSARLLVVHAGGFSKRVPHHALTGKAFAWMPPFRGSPRPFSLFEAKLVLLLDVPPLIRRGGLWLSPGDTLEFFRIRGGPPDLDLGDASPEPAACCLAHPCPLSMASSHGVFRAPAGTAIAHLQPFVCEEFLHKRSVEDLKTLASFSMQTFSDLDSTISTLSSSSSSSTTTTTTTTTTLLVKEEDTLFALTDANIFFNQPLLRLLLGFYAQASHCDTVMLAAELDVYGDFLRPLSRQHDPSYLSCVSNVTRPTPSLAPLRRMLLDLLSPHSLAVVPLLPSFYLHLGTFPEYLLHFSLTLPSLGFSHLPTSPLCPLSRVPITLDPRFSFDSNFSSSSSSTSSTSSTTSFNAPPLLLCSHVAEGASVGAHSVLEFCAIPSCSSIGRRCILVDLCARSPVAVPDDLFVYQLRLTGRRAAVLLLQLPLSLKDPSRALFSALSPDAPGLPAFLAAHPELYHAPLLFVDASPEEALRRALQAHADRALFLSPEHGPSRVSFAQCLAHGVDLPRVRSRRFLLLLCTSLRAQFAAELPVSAWQLPQPQALQEYAFDTELFVEAAPLLLSPDVHLSHNPIEMFSTLSNDQHQQQQDDEEEDDEAADKNHHSQLALSRAFHSLAHLFQSPELHHYGHRALRRYTTGLVRSPLRDLSPTVSTPPPQAVVRHFPVRIIFSGGWTDTPPYAFERPGHVVNCAIRVNGGLPIRVAVRPLPQCAHVCVASVDQGVADTLRSWEALDAHRRHEADALSIHRACLAFVFRGAAPRTGSLAEALSARLGPSTGLLLESEVDLPKGTGLGTSSMLIYGCLATLLQFLQPGREWPLEALTNGVLAVEQMIGSCGGWQDQIGGAVPGLKCTTTAPRLPHRPLRYAVERIALSPGHVEALDAHLIAIFTGQQRVANQVLSSVTTRWQLRESLVVSTLQGIAETSKQFRDAILRYSLTTESASRQTVLAELGDVLNQIRHLNIQLEPNQFIPPDIESMFQFLAPFVYGAHLLGAGAGGYIVGFLRCPDQKQELNLQFLQKFPQASFEQFNLFL